MFKEMKTGHYHKQNFYELNVSIEKLLGKVLYSCIKITEVVTLCLRKWAEFSKCCHGDVFPECLHVSGDQLLPEL